MAHDWIVLREIDFLSPRREEIGGITTEVVTSPHDIPRAMRLLSEPDSHILEFRYRDDDQPGRPLFTHDAVVRLGKNTGRVMAIEVKRHGSGTERTPAEEVLTRIANALEELVQRKVDLPRRENYAVAKQVVERGSDQLAAVS